MKYQAGTNINIAVAKPQKTHLAANVERRRAKSPKYIAEQERIRQVVAAARERER